MHPETAGDGVNKRDIGNGVLAHCFDAPIAHDSSGALTGKRTIGTLALLVTDLRAMAERGHTAGIAQFYGLLQNKMQMTEHIFMGLERKLYSDGNTNGSASKLVYTRKDAYDWVWNGDKTNGRPMQIAAPSGCVFAVFVSPNVRHRSAFPSVDGWINHWTWIDEDIAKPGAPENWSERFTKQVWTRE